MEELLPARFGPFVLLRLLGAGGMGKAYLARHRDWPGRLVVKRMHASLLGDEGLLRRFEHEARVATYVRHPNVAALVAMGTVETEPFFATEFIQGLPLSSLIERVEEGVLGALPLDIALQLGVGLVRGVEAIHESVNAETGARLELVHRDLGARNVLLGVDGQVRIIDLGLGKSAISDWQTATNMLAGSPDYMPPEQAMGKQVDRRADVYAAAVTIWELLTGVKRIKESSVAQRITRAIDAQPEPLLTHRPDASARLERLLQKAMEPDPLHRTPTATMFRAALERELAELGRAGDVAAWFESSCATALAKERRLLEEAEDVDLLREHGAGDHTQILVAHRMFVTAADAAPDATVPPALASARAAEDGEEATEARQPTARETRLVPALAAKVIQGDIHVLGRRVSEQTLFGMFVAGIVAILGLAVALFALSRTAPTPVAPAHTPSAGPLVGLPPPPSSPAASEPPSPSPSDVEPDLEPEPISPGVLSAKRALIERIRAVRKLSYAGDFQRRVTVLSARASRARTAEELAEISAAVTALERE